MTSSASTVGVVGRARERAALAALLDGAASGAGGTALLEGEAGSGKTTLVDELAHRAVDMGFDVLRAAARELEQERPFGCVREAFAPAGAGRAAVLDLLRPRAGADDDRFLILDELADLVERRCAERPQLLVLEDLHWSDPSSSLVLARLGRLAPTLPLALVASLRPVPRPAHVALALAAVLDAGGRTVRLEPLVDDEVHELARRVLGRAPTSVEAARLAEAGGNALFVVELLRAAETDPAGTDARASLPPSLRLTLLRRVSALPGPTVSALRVATVLGTEFSTADLALLLGRGPADAVQDLLPAMDAGLLQDSGGARLEFRHDLVREAVYEDLPAALRTSLHAQAARLLAQAGAAAADVARHVVLGAVPGDPAAVELLVTAARQSRSRAPSVSVELLQRALALADPLDGGDVTVQAELALALRAAGRPGSAAQQARTALASTQLPASVRFALAQSVCEALLFEGRTEELVAMAERAVRDRPDCPERRVYAGYVWLVRVLLGGEDPGQLRHLEAEAHEHLPEADDFVSCFVSFGRAFRDLADGDLDSANQHLHRALEAAEHGRLWREVVQVRSQRAFVLSWQDRVDEALEEAAAARRVAVRVGPRTEAGVTVLPWLWSGAWDELRTELDVRAQIAAETATAAGATDAAVRAFLLVKAGDPTAEEHVAHAERLLRDRGAHGAVHLAIWTRALLSAHHSGPAAGLAVLEPALRARQSDLLLVRLAGPDAVRLAVQAGDVAAGLDLCRLLDGVAARFGTTTARAAALHARARCTGDDALLHQAVALFETTSARPDERAAAQADAAVRLRRSDSARSTALLAAAVATWRRLGAHAEADRYERPERARSRPVVGWESLTEAERRVVGLLAKGLRNKQIAADLFLSPRTVETHVSRALQKLQVSSRVELAATALRHLDL